MREQYFEARQIYSATPFNIVQGNAGGPVRCQSWSTELGADRIHLTRDAHQLRRAWAKDHHDVIVVDAAGKLVADFRFDHTAGGWEEFSKRLSAFPDVAVAVETNHGGVLEKLLDQNCCVLPVHTRSAKGYRQRKVPSGNKTDRVDARSLADALRLAGAYWKQLSPQDPLTKELRLLCRDEVAFIRDRSALITQLRQVLYDYYPAALEAFDDWTMPAAWALVVAFPTPEALVKAGYRKWEKFLHTHKLGRPATYQRRLEIFARARQFAGSPPTVRAKSKLAVARAKQLQLLKTQIVEYREEIRRLFALHPDAKLFGSLPGAGDKMAPRLLAEIGDDRARFPDAQALQCLAGTRKILGVNVEPWIRLYGFFPHRARADFRQMAATDGSLPTLRSSAD